VVLYDSQSAPGGWLRDGIPRYRLAAAAVDADVQDILGLGIELRMGVEIGKDVTLDGVRRDHDAVFIAAGARSAKRLPCEGADLFGVESGLELLQRLAADEGTVEPRFAGESVVVIGGGDVAIDVARTALRLSALEVHLYCLEDRDAMPAHEREIAEAEREGVIVHPGWGPALIAGMERAERIDFHKCTSVFDGDGKFAPKLDEGVGASQLADRVLVAIGQEPALAFLASVDDTGTSPTRNIEVNADTMRTSMEGVFAGGDVVSGPASVVQAVAHGRRAASGIDLYLGGNGDVHIPLLDETEQEAGVAETEGFRDVERAPMPHLSVGEALDGFSVVELGYPPAAAMREANRCLRCDLRLSLSAVPFPPDPWLAFTEESIVHVPESAGVYRLLDDSKDVYAIAGVQSLRSALLDILSSSSKARFFLFEEEPMYSKRESELIQEYLRVHGRMPPGEGDDDLDDLF
jgi:NADPH-dependent glutamate synthase beta subunit-like oxidoreductase